MGEKDWHRAASGTVRTSSPRSGPAVVLSIAPGELRLGVPDGEVMNATVAARGYDDPQVGDRVLFFTDESSVRYVIGVLDAPRPATRSMLDELLDAETDESLREMHDRDGRLLFEYDPTTHRACLHVPDGDLTLTVPQGALRIETRDGVSLESRGPIDARSDRAVSLEVGNGETDAARIRLDRGEVALLGSTVTLAAEHAHLLATRLGIRSHHFETHVTRLEQVAEVIDTRAHRIVERARDAYREVTRLSQHRAGRIRIVAKETASLVAENTLLKARDRMKIKGERIHLA